MYLTLIIVGILLVAAPEVARAQRAFDGIWRATMTVEEGPCVRPPGISYPIMVAEGRIRAAPQSGDTGTLITGSVSSDGRVSVRVARGNDRGSASGRLSGNSGSGTWTSETLRCSGAWRATRAGN